MPIPLEDARQAIYEDLRGRILRGDPGYQPGDQIPTQDVLATSFDVAPITVTRAIRMLRADGLVVTRRRRGTFVTEWPETP